MIPKPARLLLALVPISMMSIGVSVTASAEPIFCSRGQPGCGETVIEKKVRSSFDRAVIVFVGELEAIQDSTTGISTTRTFTFRIERQFKGESAKKTVWLSIDSYLVGGKNTGTSPLRSLREFEQLEAAAEAVDTAKAKKKYHERVASLRGEIDESGAAEPSLTHVVRIDQLHGDWFIRRTDIPMRIGERYAVFVLSNLAFAADPEQPPSKISKWTNDPVDLYPMTGDRGKRALAALEQASAHAATKSLESSPGSGFVISADYEDLSPGLAIVRKGSQFKLNRPADKEEAALLQFFADKADPKSESGTSNLLLARMKWGDLTLFRLALRSKDGDTRLTIPVRCAKTCVASLSQEQIPGVADPDFPLSTFAYFEEERARQVAGELPRARSFPITVRVLPDGLPPGTPYPITIRVNMRPAFVGKSPPIYDFSSQAWRGKTGSNEVEWQALVKFLAGLRRAGAGGAANYLNEAFANDAAQHFLYTVNEFETRNGVLNVASPLVEAGVLGAKVAAWKVIVPLGTVQDGAAVRLFFSTSPQIDDIQEMPIHCGGGSCRVVPEEWVSYVHGVIQRPELLRIYRSMF